MQSSSAATLACNQGADEVAESWKSIEADGCTWQVRSVVNPDMVSGRQEVLEFQPQDGNRPPRRIVVDEGALHDMDEASLRAAYVQARPIGGDHYGRPGKRMSDAG
jgi:hypothetical protein